jgi:hypothetical protein
MNTSPSAVIGYLFFLFLVFYLTKIAFKTKGDLWEAIKGPDGKLQSVEIGMLIWFVFFPVLLLSDLFLGLDADAKIWYSMDGIFVTLVLGDLGKQFISSKKGKNED